MSERRMRAIEKAFQKLAGMSQEEFNQELIRYENDPIVDLLLELDAVDSVYNRVQESSKDWAFRSYLRNRSFPEHKKQLFTDFQTNLVESQRPPNIEGLTAGSKKTALSEHRKIDDFSYSDDYSYNIAA